MEKIFEIIGSFNNDYVKNYPPVKEKNILKAEMFFKCKLPSEYIIFLKYSNGIIIDGDVIYGIGNNEEDIINVYNREHDYVQYPMFNNIIPFSPDGGGNYYCFDINNENRIIFWQSNYPYTEQDTPEIVNETFKEWFQEVMIEWTIENNYDDLFKK
ncbi:hypothetical protein FACS189487_06100 [Campylobacterota bacterium]|nr:hypothetical protein FACS189487_06100 [Campylobacterota bacterium]